MSAASAIGRTLDELVGLGASLTLAYAKLLGIKILPLLAWAAFPRPGRLRVSALWAAALLMGIGLHLGAAQRPLVVASIAALVLAYYTASCVLVWWMAQRCVRAPLGNDVLFGLLALVGVFLPALFLRGSRQPELLAIGLGVVLSGYSYCVEARAAGFRPQLREVLFFLLVDPTVSFPDRAKPVAVDVGKALRRVLAALLWIFLGERLAPNVPRLRALWLSSWGTPLGATCAWLFAFVAVFSVVYWVRAGAAQLRSGIMQSVGFEPPACYRRPYLARNPADFWRRWNTWMGDWMRRYLFIPISLKLLRAQQMHRWMPGSRRLKVLALVISFAGVGVLHDWLIFASQGHSTLLYTRLFAFAGLGFGAWEALRVSAYGAWLASRLPRAQRTAEFAYALGYVACLFWISGSV